MTAALTITVNCLGPNQDYRKQFVEKIKVYFVGNVAKTCQSTIIQMHLIVDKAINVNMASFSTCTANSSEAHFLIILLFNISLTSGDLYSFVFYPQILTRLSIKAYGTILIKDAIAKKTLLFIIENNYSRLCTNGFTSFCTNSIMNLLMIMYATRAYAFFLVIITIVVLRLNSCCSCVKLHRCCGRKNIVLWSAYHCVAFLVCVCFVSQCIHWFIPTSVRFLFRNHFMETCFCSFLIMHKKLLAMPTHPCLIISLLRGQQHLQQNGVYSMVAHCLVIV